MRISDLKLKKYFRMVPAALLGLSLLVLHLPSVSGNLYNSTPNANTLSVALLVLFTITSVPFVQRFSFGLTDVCMLIFSVVPVIFTLPEIHTEYFIVGVGALLIWFICNNSRLIRATLMKSFFVWAYLIVFIELLYCVAQYFSWIQNINPIYQVGGITGHPTFTMASVCVLIPLLIQRVLEGKSKKIESWIVFLAVVLLILFALILETRAPLISIVVVLFAVYTQGRPIRWSAIKIAGLASATLVIVATLFFYKYDSSNGRLFIWKNCLQIISDSPVMGAGLGKFEHVNNKTQHDYFVSGQQTAYEELRADYINYAYNDFLEVFVEGGVISFLAIVILFIIPFFVFGFGKKVNTYFILFLSFIPLSVTWTTLKYPALLIPLVISMAMMHNYSHGFFSGFSVHIKSAKPIKILIVLCACFVFAMIYRIHNGYHFYLDARKSGSIALYEKADHILYYSLQVKMDYASQLMLEHRYPEASAVVSQAIIWHYSPWLFIKQGEIAEAAGNTNEAIRCYQTAHHIDPSLLYPQHLLAIHYFEKGDYAQASKLTKEILERPVSKNSSAQEFLMREKLNFFLRKYKGER